MPTTTPPDTLAVLKDQANARIQNADRDTLLLLYPLLRFRAHHLLLGDRFNRIRSGLTQVGVWRLQELAQSRQGFVLTPRHRFRGGACRRHHRQLLKLLSFTPRSDHAGHHVEINNLPALAPENAIKYAKGMASYLVYLLELGEEIRVVFPGDKKDIGHTDFWE